MMIYTPFLFLFKKLSASIPAVLLFPKPLLRTKKPGCPALFPVFHFTCGKIENLGGVA